MDPEECQPLNHFRDLVQVTVNDLDEMPVTTLKHTATGDGTCLIHSVIISSGVVGKDREGDLPIRG
jgi:hypothetical protein